MAHLFEVSWHENKMTCHASTAAEAQKIAAEYILSTGKLLTRALDEWERYASHDLAETP